MILLPWPPRRATLIGFCLSVSILAGSLSAGLWWLCGVPRWPMWAATTGMVLFVAGVIHSDKLYRPYAWWNRVARRFSQVATAWVTGLCFHLVLAAIGRRNSAVRLDRPAKDASLWVPRGPGPTDATPVRPTDSEKKSPMWTGEFLRWARVSQNAWAIWLLPTVWLLRWLEGDESDSFPENIYTLY